MTGLGPLARAMADAVVADRRQRVPLKVLVQAATSVDQSGPGRVDWRSRVAAAIEELAASGMVACPATRWDRRTQPPLPEWVAKPARVALAAAGPSEPWHVALRWVPAISAERRLTVSEERLLMAVNRWLPGAEDALVVPMRERSWHLVGDDKALERLRFGRLFGPGRLSMELLCCRATGPPVHQLVLGPGPWLVVENWSTFESLGSTAARCGFSGRVIFGSGNQVATRLAALADANERPARPVLYFGDIDGGGVRAARLAATVARQLDWPPVEPCRPLYALALESPHRLADTPAAGHSVDWARTWIGGTLGDQVADCLASGRAVRQEGVGLEALRGRDVRSLLGPH